MSEQNSYEKGEYPSLKEKRDAFRNQYVQALISGEEKRYQMPQLSLQERERRWNSVRQKMAQRGLDCLIVHGDSGKYDSMMANIRYLTHIGGHGEEGYAVFPLQGEVTVFIVYLSIWWMTAQNWVTDVRTGPPSWSKSLATCVQEKGLESRKIGLVGMGSMQGYGGLSEGRFPLGVYNRLHELLPHATFVPADDILEEMRLIKSAEEISCHEKAAVMGDAAVRAMATAAKPGIKEYQVYSRVIESMMDLGSEHPVMFHWEAGSRVHHAGKFPAWRALEPGDVIVNEISPRYCGYWAHPHQPMSVGKPASIYLELFKVLLEGFHAGFEAMKPGNSLQDVDRAYMGPILKNGYDFLHPCIHGLGLALPEFPFTRMHDLPELVPDDEMRIQPGMVFAYEPMICTSDQRIGIPLGDTVVIEEKGARRLSTRELEFIIA